MVDFLNALSFPNIFCLRSGAGSGKTFSLACWYLRILLSNKALFDDPDGYRKILGITFTNKASKEMKERIIYFLKAIALGNKAVTDKIKGFEELKNIHSVAFAEKARKIMNNILKNYEQFHIKTIDSYIFFILKSISLNIGLNPGFEIADEKNDLIKEAFRFYVCDILNNNKADEINILKEIISSHFFYETDSYFPEDKILSSIDKIFLSNEGIFGRKFHSDLENEDDITAIFKKISSAVHKFINSYKKYNLGPCKNFNNLLNNLKNIEDKSFKDFQKLLKSRYIRKNMDKFFNKKPDISYDVYSDWQAIYDLISSAVEYNAENYYKNHILLYNNIKKYLARQKKESNTIFIEDLNVLMRDFIIGHKNPMLLDNNLEHFLIDEFQDTSLLQLENLKDSITEKLAEKGSLFVVGDRKQAIYRFRGSDSRIFDRLPGYFQVPVNSAVLHYNYRSLENIVAFNNNVFEEHNIRRWCMNIFKHALKDLDKSNITGRFIGPIVDDYQGPFQKAARKDDINKGLISINTLTKEDDYSYLERILKNDLLLRYEPKDIAILTFKNEESREVSQFLSGCRIPNISDNSLDIRKNHIVKSVIALLTYLAYQQKETFLFEFLFSNTFEKWISKFRKNYNRYDLLNGLECRNKETPLISEACKMFPELQGSLFTPVNAYSNIQSYYFYCRRICSILKVLENFPEEAVFLYKFFEFIQEYSNRTDFSTEMVLKILNSEDSNKELEIETTEQLNAIKVLTIHKSKGLQFPVVIIPSIRLNHRKATKINNITKIENDMINLYRLNKDSLKLSSKLMDLYAEELAMNISDSLNMFYVALTRPEDELYLYFKEKTDQAIKYLSLLTPEDMPARTMENNNHTIGIKTQKDKKTINNEKAFKIKPTGQSINCEHFFQEEAGNFPVISGSLEEIRVKKMILSFLRTHKFKKNEKSMCINDVFQKFFRASGFNEALSSKALPRVCELLQNEEIKHFHFNEDINIKTLNPYFFIDNTSSKIRFDRIMFKEQSIEVLNYAEHYTEEDLLNLSSNLKKLKNVKVCSVYKVFKGFVLYLNNEVRSVVVGEN